MALRQMVTGSDVCAPSDGTGGGPANAAMALADQLLGTKRGGGAGEQSQLQAMQQMAGAARPVAAPSAQAPVQAPSVADAARAVTEGDPLHDFAPAAGSVGFADADINAFMRQQIHGPPPVQPQLQPQGFGRPLQMAQPHAHGVPPLSPGGQAARPFLQAFVESGKAGVEFLPMPQSGMQMSVDEQVRVRDRSTIVARHIYAGRGDKYADAQVVKLLHSLNINPAQLPAKLEDRGNWDAVFHRGMQLGPAADMAAAGQMVAQRPQEAAWADEFAGMSLHDGPHPRQQGLHDQFLQQHHSPPQQWAEEFDAQPDSWASDFQQHHQQQQQPQGWAGEFGAQQNGDWATDFQTEQDAASVPRAVHEARNSDDVMAHTRALRDAISADQDPKFQKSKFLSFLSKMTQGEIILEDNQVKETKQGADWAREFDAQPKANGWASEFQSQQPAANGWASEFQAQQPPVQRWASEGDRRSGTAGVEWASEFGEAQQSQDWSEQFGRDRVVEGVDGVDRWADDFASGVTGDVEEWAEQFAGDNWAAEFAQAASAVGAPRTRQEGYQFAADNPYKDDLDSFTKAKELFRRGVLSEAILALEAEVARSPGHTAAWRLLGTAHAENEDDIQAIAALDSALKADPADLEVLLSLGVSHTNELDQAEALDYLQRWLAQHPTHAFAAREAPPLLDSSQRHSHTVRQFEAAARAQPSDADLKVALGVLHNLSRRYDEAISAFQNALTLRPNDYSLWNKLGATLANGSRSGEAVAAYQKALELKPNYMRAWANMGISQANLGNYDASARFYVRALGLNSSAESVWGYLRTSLSCSGRLDLMPLVDSENLERLQKQLPLH